MNTFRIYWFFLSSSNFLPYFLQNHDFVDEKTYEPTCREVTLLTQVSRSSSISSSSPHFASCCTGKKRKTFIIPNSNMSAGLQSTVQELSTIQIRERPPSNRWETNPPCFTVYIIYIYCCILLRVCME